MKIAFIITELVVISFFIILIFAWSKSEKDHAAKMKEIEKETEYWKKKISFP